MSLHSPQARASKTADTPSPPPMRLMTVSIANKSSSTNDGNRSQRHALSNNGVRGVCSEFGE
eukprot:scaffold19470_cov27-Attheya_sp.AAC.3